MAVTIAWLADTEVSASLPSCIRTAFTVKNTLRLAETGCGMAAHKCSAHARQRSTWHNTLVHVSWYASSGSKSTRVTIAQAGKAGVRGLLWYQPEEALVRIRPLLSATGFAAARRRRKPYVLICLDCCDKASGTSAAAVGALPAHCAMCA